jgi:hypothetical protein
MIFAFPPEGDVWVISGASGAADSFRATSALPQVCLDTPLRHDLPSFMIGGWQNRYEDARSAVVAKNQFLLFPISYISLADY